MSVNTIPCRFFRQFFHETGLRRFLMVGVLLIFVFVLCAEPCVAQLFRRGERLRSLQRKVRKELKEEAKDRESDIRRFRDKVRSELSGVADSSPREELRPLLDTIKDVIQTPPPVFGQSGRLTLAYMASIQNLAELDTVLGKVAKEVDSEDLYYNFRASSQHWGGNFIDPNRTSGFALLTNGFFTYPMLFVPIFPTDAAAYDFLSTFGASDERGIVRPQQAEGFRWVWLGDNPYVQFPEDTIVVQKGDWGYFIPQKLLPLLPSDPQTLFPRFDGKYLIYDYVTLSGLPRHLGNGALTLGELFLRISHRRQIKIGSTKIKLTSEQKEMLLGVLKFSRVLLNEVDTVFRGLKRNDETGDFIVETTVEVVPGGKLWHYIETQRTRTTLAGFFYEPEDAMYAGIFSDDLEPNLKRSLHALVRSGFGDIENRILEKQRQRQLKKEQKQNSGETPVQESTAVGKPDKKTPLEKLKTPPKDLKKAAEKTEHFFEDALSKVLKKSSKNSHEKKVSDKSLLENFDEEPGEEESFDEPKPDTSRFPFDNQNDSTDSGEPVDLSDFEELFGPDDSAEEESGEISIFETETEGDHVSESTQPSTPGNLAGSLIGSMGQFFSSTWDKSVSTALQATAEQIEVEFVRKMQQLVHDNVERGLLDAAITVRADGTTLGAAQIVGGDTISTILTAAQIKVSTDSQLRGHIRFNAQEHRGFKISKIEIPVRKIPKIEELLGKETLPESLYDVNLCVYFAIRDDFICFTAGSEPKLLDELLKRIDLMNPNNPMPSTTLRFSPYLCGCLFEPFLEGIQDESTRKILTAFLDSHPDSLLLYQVAYGPGSYYSTLVLPPAIVKTLNEIGKSQFPFLTGQIQKLGTR